MIHLFQSASKWNECVILNLKKYYYYYCCQYLQLGCSTNGVKLSIINS